MLPGTTVFAVVLGEPLTLLVPNSLRIKQPRMCGKAHSGVIYVLLIACITNCTYIYKSVFPPHVCRCGSLERPRPRTQCLHGYWHMEALVSAWAWQHVSGKTTKLGNCFGLGGAYTAAAAFKRHALVQRGPCEHYATYLSRIPVPHNPQHGV